jgi:hypothetical protein
MLTKDDVIEAKGLVDDVVTQAQEVVVSNARNDIVTGKNLDEASRLESTFTLT